MASASDTSAPHIPLNLYYHDHSCNMLSSLFAPNAGSGMPTAETPSSEHSVYYDANNGSGEQNADVARKPTVAAGAHDSRKPGVGGGTLTNKQGHDNRKSGEAVRDSGYASGLADKKERQRSVGLVSPQSAKHEREDQPSPAYVQHGNTFGTSDSKAAATGARTNGGEKANVTGPSDRSPKQFQTQQSPHAQQHPGAQDPVSMSSRESMPHTSGAFANGAGATGPNAQLEDDVTMHQRIGTAESHLSDEAKKKITKSEVKDSKAFMKVIKSEGKAQKANLSACLKELSKLQTVQKQASKAESKAISAHSKASSTAHTRHTKSIEAKAAFEQAEAELNARAENLESARVHAQEKTAELANKTRELEELRRAKAVDDRERAAKLSELSQTGNA